MSLYDVIVRGGVVVTPTGPARADIGVADGRIEAVGPDLEGAANVEIEAGGLHIFPGVIDPHVHCNEPGRADWEGFATATSALAAGGATAFFDMPLNAHPPTVDAAAFDAKLARAQDASLIDFALWGGIVPGNLDRLDELAARGVIGFKAFMSNSGIADFAAADDLTLYEGMVRAGQLGRVVAVHAENDAITGLLARRAVAEGRLTSRDYLASRPVVAELEAIQRAITLAGLAGCALHIVHVSTGQGVALVAAAWASGADVSCETCPHYLVLTDEDVVRLGAVAKCAPPLRPSAQREALWRHIEQGHVAMVASDHSPSPAALKEGADFFGVWGGVSGCQSTLQLLLTEGHYRRRLALRDITRVLSEGAARRFALWPAKGSLTRGADADLALVDLEPLAVLRQDDLFYRHRHSPYVGRGLRGRVVSTLVRGTTVYQNGRIVSPPVGRLLRPGYAPSVTPQSLLPGQDHGASTGKLT